MSIVDPPGADRRDPRRQRRGPGTRQIIVNVAKAVTAVALLAKTIIKLLQ